MMKKQYYLMSAALSGALLLAACSDSSSTTPQSTNPPSTQPGLAERAGKAIDNAAEKTGKTLETAGEKAAEAAKDTGRYVRDTSKELANKTEKALERAGENTRNTGEDIERNVDDMASRAASAARPSPSQDMGVGVAPGINNNQPVTTPPATQPGSVAQSPSGIDTSKLKLADATAQRLMDQIQTEAKDGGNDKDHIRRLVSELKDMRGDLSPEYQRKVDTLVRTYPDPEVNPNQNTAADQ